MSDRTGLPSEPSDHKEGWPGSSADHSTKLILPLDDIRPTPEPDDNPDSAIEPDDDIRPTPEPDDPS